MTSSSTSASRSSSRPDGKIDEVQLATITARLDERHKEIAAVLANAGWRSPLEPLAGGDVHKLSSALSLAHKRAIVDLVCSVHVLPSQPTIRGFDPSGVRIDWKVR